MNKNRLILLILDGWGYSKEQIPNAIKEAGTPIFNSLLQDGKWTLINASEEYVGLPKGQMGNSEVGHTSIGSGRVIYQDLLRISKDIENKTVLKNKEINRLFQETASSSNRLHLIGLLSDGGVHSHIDHFKGIVLAAKDAGIKEVYIHAITDGRDTPPSSALNFITDFNNFLNNNQLGKIATITGRFYAMDRDKRWERIEAAWNNFRFSKSQQEFKDPIEALNNISETDEFIKPTKITSVDGNIKDGDSVFLMNFRADRMRELVTVMTSDNFTEFDRGTKPKLNIITMTEYDKSFNLPIAYPPEDLQNVFGEVISKKGLKQLRIAETEKYAHVTFFFNGGREDIFNGEERSLIASPRDIATYDLKPEMSLYEVEETFEKIFRKGDIDVVIMNFANPDMVGHTGVLDSAVSACKAVDECIGKVMKTAKDMNAALIVTADHGNAEEMWDYSSNQPHTAHTLNPVVFAIYNCDNYKIKQEYSVNGSINPEDIKGKLADIAPTMLKILGIDKPVEMTGESLIN